MSDELDESGVDTGQAVTSTTPLRPTGKRTRRGGADTLTLSQTNGTTESSLDEAGKTKKAKKPAKSGPSRNPFVQIWVFLTQVVAELRKVIWPNRKQMISYTSVVVVFLIFMVALIGAIDLALARLVMLVFG